ncbi:hypothetical protein [Streptomyces sp. NRRL F-5630]|uniref:hypothetical protein n=1 Tax=Streptomyces sp. NRRL F-5630 TaxID=1463864 RepID=UPI000A4A0896|nr:hypothetical protein [Streptomyces sp. NRRL F-5630]
MSAELTSFVERLPDTPDRCPVCIEEAQRWVMARSRYDYSAATDAAVRIRRHPDHEEGR